jgi:hypothetical protein
LIAVQVTLAPASEASSIAIATASYQPVRCGCHPPGVPGP